MTSNDDRTVRGRRLGIGLGLLFGLPLLIAVLAQVWAPRGRHGGFSSALEPGSARHPSTSASRGSSGGGSPSLVMVQSPGENPGGSVVGAPAVDPNQIANRLTSAGAATGGEVEVSLAWNSLTDLDLQVRDPSGELVDALHPQSASGGVQDVDANPTLVSQEASRRVDAGQHLQPDEVMPVPEILIEEPNRAWDPLRPWRELMRGSGSGKAPSKFTRTPVEHIYFSRAPKGTYTVFAHCYSWRERDSNPLPFTVQIRSHGTVVSQTSSTLGPTCYIFDHTAPTQVCQFEMK